MERNNIARASVIVEALPDKVWQALVDPDAIREYMFGAEVETDWTEGGAIVWKGEWKGKPYEDKGIIKQLRPGSRLHFSHYSQLAGQPDAPENYHNVTIDLTDLGETTRVDLSQDGNPSEEARLHSEQNWQKMLEGLKAFVERRAKTELRGRHEESDRGDVIMT